MSSLWVDHILDWVVGSLTQFLQSYDKTELRKALTISSVRNFDISSSLKRPTNNKKFSLCKLCKAQENIHILWKQLQILKAYAEQWNICISYWYWFQKKNPQISTTEHLWFLQGFAISNIFVAVSPSKTWRKSQNWIPFPFFARNKKWNGIPAEWLIFGEKSIIQ